MQARAAMASFVFLLLVIVTLQSELVRSSPLHQSENTRVRAEEMVSNKLRGISVEQDDEEDDDKGSLASDLLSRAEQAVLVKSE